MKVVFHIGAHKTATTHLQRMLRRNAPALRAAGIACLGPWALREPPLDLTVLARPETPEDPAAAAALRDACAGAGWLLLSEENILGTAHHPEIVRQGRFYPRAEARLAKALGQLGIDRVELALSVRDPASFFVSTYAQKLFSGRLVGFEDFLEGRDVIAMRWSECVARIAALPMVSGVTVWRYEDYRALGLELHRALMGDGAPPLAVPEGDVHAGLSAAAHAQIMAWVAEDRPPPPRGHARAARDLHPKIPGVASYQPWPETALARSAALYAEDIGRIAALPGVTLLRPDA